MILQFLFWYLAIVLAGWLVYPLAYRLLPFLPDRGYTLMKPLGLLLWGYLYWILVSLNIIENDIGGVVFALLAVATLSALTLRHENRQALSQWLNENLNGIVLAEVIFFAAFGLWTVVRAANPDASGTEKPMELAFINAILHSPTFPPHDPWLSGYAISYYYFGYVIVAMLARFTGVAGGVAFNLGVASWFALTAAAAYGVLVNLLAARDLSVRRLAENVTAVFGGLLAPLFVLLVSNLEGFLEMLHSAGLFWRQNPDGTWSSSFWSWLGIQELVNPPQAPFSLVPERVGGIWWWRASRVLQDFDAAGNPREIIDEFPAFSYLLGDLHPHVLAMPFVFLAVALALNLYLRRRTEPVDAFLLRDWLRRPDMWLAAVVLGGLAFLNTWDFPIYLALFGAAYVLARYHCQGWQWQYVVDFILLCAVVGAAGIALYLPFYIGFASQAGGILPSLVYSTRGIHFWVMFAPLLLPLLAWLVSLWVRHRSSLGTHSAVPSPLLVGLLFAVGIVGGLWLLSSLVGAVAAENNSLAGIYGGFGAVTLLTEAFARRLTQPGTWLSLLLMLGLTWALFIVLRQSGSQWEGSPAGNLPDPFVLLLVLLGSGLVLFPEFFYLRDQFGWRMNTIFKFYFQAWIIWAVAAAYASVVILRAVRGVMVPLVGLAWTALMAAALVYPAFGLLERTNNFDPGAWTLNGSAYLERFSFGELEAIRWLSSAPRGVVAEAVGGSYSGYARVSTHSGQPSVLGWPGHESQWRGGTAEIGSREPDLEQLFRASRWEQAQPILERYDIRYVFVGAMERGKYRVNEELFQRYLDPVYQNNQVTIYEVSGYPEDSEQVKRP